METRPSRWQAQHVGCQQAVDNVKADLMAEIDQVRTMPLTFTCHDCGEYFVETVERFLNEGRESGEPILAPTLCVDCGHGGEPRQIRDAVPGDTLVDEGIVPSSFRWPTE